MDKWEEIKNPEAPATDDVETLLAHALRAVLEWPNPRGQIQHEYIPPWLANHSWDVLNRWLAMPRKAEAEPFAPCQLGACGLAPDSIVHNHAMQGYYEHPHMGEAATVTEARRIIAETTRTDVKN